MEMPSRHVLLFFLCFLIHVASSFYLEDHRRPKLRTFLDRRNEDISHLEQKSQRFDRSGQMQGTGRRGNETDNQSQPGASGTFINCVFTFDSENRPQYDCKVSEDVNMSWTSQDHQWTGIFTTKFHCSNRRDVRHKMQSPHHTVDRRWKLLIRDKRKTVYRDDAEAEDAQDEETQQIQEEDVVPEVNQDVTEGEDGIEDSQVSQPMDGKEEITDEEDKEQKEVEENGVEETKEVNEVEKEEDDEANIVDETVSASNVPEIDNGADEGNQGDSEEVLDTEDSVVTEEPTKNENQDQTNGEGKNDEEKEGKGDDTDAVEGKGDDTDAVEGNNDDKEDEKVNVHIPNVEIAKDDYYDYEYDDYDSILVPIQIDIEVIIEQPDFPLLLQLVKDLLAKAGDYLLSFLMRSLKQRLRHARIEERFDRKVDILASGHGNNTDEALLIMKKKIREQLGKSYQLEIVRYLKQLYEDMKH